MSVIISKLKKNFFIIIVKFYTIYKKIFKKSIEIKNIYCRKKNPQKSRKEDAAKKEDVVKERIQKSLNQPNQKSQKTCGKDLM